MQVPLPCLHACRSIPGVPQPLCARQCNTDVDAQWTFNLATYNANSLKKEVDRQLLDRFLWNHEVRIAGVQESRTFPGAKSRTAHYTCFCSPDSHGNFGCQLWVGAGAVASRADGTSVSLDVHQAVIMHSDPRILAVSIPAGRLLMTFVVAHAPIAAAPVLEREEWWQAFTRVLRKIPRRSIPFVMVDANARFDVHSPQQCLAAAKPCSDNATALQSLADDHDFQAAGFFDRQGRRLVTWTSPSGLDSHIDYILVPSPLAQDTCMHALDREHAHLRGHDHHVSVASVSWRQATTINQARPRWDRKKLASTEGQCILRDIYRSAPSIPWTFHVDDHAHLLNCHLYNGLVQHFQAATTTTTHLRWAVAGHTLEAPS